MSKSASKHAWVFGPRFRSGSYGWRSEPAITRIKEAVSEIKAAARKDPVLAADGAVLFLRKVSAAFQNVDSSSGAIGSAVNRAIDASVPMIAKAPAEPAVRRRSHQGFSRFHTVWAIVGRPGLLFHVNGGTMRTSMWSIR